LIPLKFIILLLFHASFVVFSKPAQKQRFAINFIIFLKNCKVKTPKKKKPVSLA